jgi:sugar/nucleoside kinase (ribokinase family)
MSALICGSLAYDTIMVFPDQFKNHILPDKVHILNVSFLVPRMRREFGGCAGNIAYNLKLLGGEPIPMATVGQDFGPYREWFEEQGIDMSQVPRMEPEQIVTASLADLTRGVVVSIPGMPEESAKARFDDAAATLLGVARTAELPARYRTD